MHAANVTQTYRMRSKGDVALECRKSRSRLGADTAGNVVRIHTVGGSWSGSVRVSSSTAYVNTAAYDTANPVCICALD